MHFAHVKRYGNQVILQLDAGEGPLYAEHWPADEHRLLRVGKASGGGEVVRNVWTNMISVQSIAGSKNFILLLWNTKFISAVSVLFSCTNCGNAPLNAYQFTANICQSTVVMYKRPHVNSTV